MSRKLVPVLLLCFTVACRPYIFPPKPPGYFRIDTPATHQYQLFDRPDFPYIFEYPINASIEKDTLFQKDKGSNPYWINIYIHGLEGVINLTYKEITKEDPLVKLVNDAWGYSFFHHEKADGY